MGGSKNQSPAQREKSQKKESDKKDGKKKKDKKSEGSGSGKSEISVIVNEDHASKYLKDAKVITVHELAKRTGVKTSAANAYLLKLLAKGDVKRVGGYSGHHLYQPVAK